jgi:hypothetical protein
MVRFSCRYLIVKFILVSGSFLTLKGVALSPCVKTIVLGDRQLHLNVDLGKQTGKVKALIIEQSNTSDPIRSLMTGIISPDGKTFTSQLRVTAPEDAGKGFQRLLSTEVSKFFPNIEKYNTSLIEENGIALMQNALASITGKKSSSFVSKDTFGWDLAKKLNKLLVQKTEAERFYILSEAAMLTHEYRLAKTMMGNVAIKAVTLELIPGDLYRIKLEIEKVPLMQSET